MAAMDRILAIDIGAGSLRVAEFSCTKSDLVLENFDWRSIDAESEVNGAQQISAALKSIVESGGYNFKDAYICTSGQSAFVRFVKLPPITTNIEKIVEFEAQQHIPFPMDEVSWDYQLLGDPDGGEIEVMFVVVKNEIVERITDGVAGAALTPNLVELSSAALLNAARANNIGNDECVMLLDIGDRCSDLIFIDGNRFFNRTILIAGNTITQQIAKEFQIGLDEAEELKKRHGFVSLGGAYEEPESEVASVISKIVRNVMTRLHSEIIKTKSIYCNQQKGNAPTKLYLTGGGSVMAYTDTFFNEKLKMDVEYFNPFGAVKLGDGVDPDKLQYVAHMYGASIGTALRKNMECPVQINLMPASYKQREKLQAKKPKILLNCGLAVATGLIYFLVNGVIAGNYQSLQSDNGSLIASAESLKDEVADLKNQLEMKEQEYAKLSKLVAKTGGITPLLTAIEAAIPTNVDLIEISPVYQKAEDEEEEDSFGSRTSRFSRGGSGSRKEELGANNAAAITGIKIRFSQIRTEKGTDTQPFLVFQRNLEQSGIFDGKLTINNDFNTGYSNLSLGEISGNFKKPISLVRD